MADPIIDAPNRRPFRFMDLPRELRLMVYEYLTKQFICPLTVPDCGIAFQATVIDPNCARVSRLFREEAEAATPSSKGRAIVYFDKFEDPYIECILYTIDMACGFDNNHLQKHQPSSENACFVPPVPRLAITAGLHKFETLQHYANWTVDMAKSKCIVRPFLQQSVLKLRQNPQVEFRVLIADSTVPDKIDMVWGFTQNHGGLERFIKLQWCVTVVYQDEKTLKAAPGILARLPQKLATPEEVAYMKKIGN